MQRKYRVRIQSMELPRYRMRRRPKNDLTRELALEPIAITPQRPPVDEELVGDEATFGTQLSPTRRT